MQMEAVDALVIGAGPAGLMAAEALSQAGRHVVICESKPSPARKFLMAGKSGLNLMNAAPLDEQIAIYGRAADWLDPMLKAFGPAEIKDWAEGLGEALFTGSSGRVFPRAMKASPLLRAWLARLERRNVTLRRGWRWLGNGFEFASPGGPCSLMPRVCILALGGASWARLGSDGFWTEHLLAKGVPLAPFRPANIGFHVNWSDHMDSLHGQPVKAVMLHAGAQCVRAEFVITRRGVEGGGIYALSEAVLDGEQVQIDLFPDLSTTEIAAKLARQPRKLSTTNRLRRALGLTGTRLALLMETARPLPAEPLMLAGRLKSVPLPLRAPFPIDEAISTSGGVMQAGVTETLMLRNWPGVFAAGEMLDWTAPTGGYLLTACLATGRWAGAHAARYG